MHLGKTRFVFAGAGQILTRILATAQYAVQVLAVVFYQKEICLSGGHEGGAASLVAMCR